MGGQTQTFPAAVIEHPASASGPSARTARLRLRFIAATLGVLIGLMLAEMTVRLVAPQHPSWLDIFAKTDSPPFGLMPNAERIISTGETNWTVYTDAQGFRCAAHPLAPADAPLVLVLGDSYAFGMGVNYEQTFPGLLEKSMGGKYRFLNTGVPSYGPTQYRQVLERQLARGAKPAAVLVVTYTGNDFHDCIWDKNLPVRDGILGNDASVRGFIKRHLHLYRLVSRAYHTSHEKEMAQWPHHAELYRPGEWETGKLKGANELYQLEFARISALCRSRNIPLLACIIPTPTAVEASEATTRPEPAASAPQYELPGHQAERAMTAAGIHCVDLTAPLGRVGMTKTYFAWDQHLSATGNRVAADAILANWAELSK
jgi:hypothetical protein